MHNPWKTLESKVMYKNPWIEVQEDTVIRPDGKPGIYSVVHARYAVGVIALTDKREVVMVGQYRYPLNTYSWEIVEGGAEPGATPIETARAELHEEAGFIADELVQLPGELHFSNSFSSERGAIFIARGLRQIGAEPEGTEVLKVEYWPVETVLARIDDGSITDGFTVYGVLRAHRLGYL